MDIPLETMRDQLLHRGPDDRGLWFSADRRIGLGHTRLSIIDLTQDAHQPMILDGGKFAIVFNGEIYNFPEIRLELERSGCHFSSRSDTEVILQAYRAWGTSCVARFDGMFAFSLYDAAKQSVFIARDRAGEKPLFYTIDSGKLIWASEIKALFAWPKLRRRVDPRALGDYLSYGFVGGEDCIIEGVHKLRPAHGLVFNLHDGTSSIFRYWNVPGASIRTMQGANESDPPPTKQLIDELRGLLTETVRQRMIADVPTGILLSSGIDSALIAATASQMSSGPVNTFTVINPAAPKLDEGPGARMIAKMIGAKHQELLIDSLDGSVLETLAHQYDEPIADHSIIPTYLICKAISSQVKVVLGGDGGDELFGGYPHYRFIARQATLRRTLPEGARRSISLFAEHVLPVGFRGRNHLIGLSGNIDNAIAHVNVYFDQHSQAQLLGRRWYRPEDWQLARRRRDQFQLSEMSPVLRAMQTDFQSVLPDNYLVKTDRASMLASMELRSPFLAPKIIDFAFNRVPQPLRFDGTEQKILLRRLGAELIPGWNPPQKKHGFVVPLDEWIKGPMGEHFKDILTDPGQVLFSKSYIEKLFTLNRYGANNSNRIFCLVMFELWRREYNPELPS